VHRFAFVLFWNYKTHCIYACRLHLYSLYDPSIQSWNITLQNYITFYFYFKFYYNNNMAIYLYIFYLYWILSSNFSYLIDYVMHANIHNIQQLAIVKFWTVNFVQLCAEVQCNVQWCTLFMYSYMYLKQICFIASSNGFTSSFDLNS
jgi:hypothetical protein